MRGLSEKAGPGRWWALLALLLVVIAVPGAALSAGPTNVSGTISVDTTWTAANSPYIVTGNVTVASGVTLTVEPGVVVKLNSQFREMRVNGTLKAIGTAALPITFTSIQDDTVGGDLSRVTKFGMGVSVGLLVKGAFCGTPVCVFC